MRCLVGWYLCLKTSCFQVIRGSAWGILSFPPTELSGWNAWWSIWPPTRVVCKRSGAFFWGFFFLTRRIATVWLVPPEFVDKTRRDTISYICLVMGTPNVTDETSSSAMASRRPRREDSSGLQLVNWKTSRLSIMWPNNSYANMTHELSLHIYIYIYICMNPRKDMWHQNKSNPWKIRKEINIDQHKPQGFAVVGPLKSGQARHIVDFRDGSWYREDVYDFLRYACFRKPPGVKVESVESFHGFFPRSHGVNIWWVHDPLVLGRRLNMNTFFLVQKLSWHHFWYLWSCQWWTGSKAKPHSR